MERKDAVSNADMYALSRMNPLAKKAENTQIILMYERLLAGKKTIGEVFHETVENTVEMCSLDVRMSGYMQSMCRELNASRTLLTDMQQQQEHIRKLEEQVRLSQNFFREALEEVRKENKIIRRLCNEFIQNDREENSADMESYHTLKQQMDEMQSKMDDMILENRQLSKNFQEMMEYVRIYQSGALNLQKKNEILLDVRQDMKKVADRNMRLTKSFAELSSEMGKMAQDRFYMLDNAMFKGILSSAVQCHKEWMRNFRRYVDTGKENELQFDWRLSGFGICYLAVYPKHHDIVKQWFKIGNLHEEIHKLALDSTKQVEKGQFEKARMIYEKAKDLSELLLEHVDYITKKLKYIEKRKENVFENYI